MMRRLSKCIHMREANPIQRKGDERRRGPASETSNGLVDGLRLVRDPHNGSSGIGDDALENQQAIAHAHDIAERGNRALEVIQEAEAMDDVETPERHEIQRLYIARDATHSRMTAAALVDDVHAAVHSGHLA